MAISWERMRCPSTKPALLAPADCIQPPPPPPLAYYKLPVLFNFYLSMYPLSDQRIIKELIRRALQYPQDRGDSLTQ